MPKIIENPESRLMEEARRQIETVGYGATTIRSVARECGVGVGTVYNYFPSKDGLLAAYLLSDWKECICAIDAVSMDAETPEQVLLCIHEQLLAYTDRHKAIFRDREAVAGFAGSFARYHGVLRSQLAAPLRKFCSSDFASEFIAESLLTWTLEGRPFPEIYGMMCKLV